MKEELRRRESGVEAVLDEALRSRNFRVALEVRQSSVLEAVGNSLAVQSLLADTGDHLGDVDERTLRAENETACYGITSSGTYFCYVFKCWRVRH